MGRRRKPHIRRESGHVGAEELAKPLPKVDAPASANDGSTWEEKIDRLSGAEASRDVRPLDGGTLRKQLDREARARDRQPVPERTPEGNPERVRMLHQLYDMHNELRGVIRYAQSEDGTEMSTADVVRNVNLVLNKGLGVLRNAGAPTSIVEGLRKTLFVAEPKEAPKVFGKTVGEQDPQRQRQAILKKAEDSMRALDRQAGAVMGVDRADLDAFRSEREEMQRGTEKVVPIPESTRTRAPSPDYTAAERQHLEDWEAGMQEDHPYAVEMGAQDTMQDGLQDTISASAESDTDLAAAGVPAQGVTGQEQLESVYDKAGWRSDAFGELRDEAVAKARGLDDEELTVRERRDTESEADDQVVEADVLPPTGINERPPANGEVIDVEPLDDVDVVEADILPPQSIHERTPSKGEVIDVEPIGDAEEVEPERDAVLAEALMLAHGLDGGPDGSSQESGEAGQEGAPDDSKEDRETIRENIDLDPRYQEIKERLQTDLVDHYISAFEKEFGFTREESIWALKNDGRIKEQPDGTYVAVVSPVMLHDAFAQTHPDAYKSYAEIEADRIYEDPFMEDPALIRLGAQLHRLHGHYEANWRRDDGSMAEGKKNEFKIHIGEQFKTFAENYPNKAAAYAEHHEGFADFDTWFRKWQNGELGADQEDESAGAETAPDGDQESREAIRENIDLDPRYQEIKERLSKDQVDQYIRAFEQSFGMTRDEAIWSLKNDGWIEEHPDGSFTAFVSPVALHDEFAAKYSEAYRAYDVIEQTRIYENPFREDPAIIRFGGQLHQLHAHFESRYREPDGTMPEDRQRELAFYIEQQFKDFAERFPEKAAGYADKHEGFANFQEWLLKWRAEHGYDYWDDDVDLGDPINDMDFGDMGTANDGDYSVNEPEPGREGMADLPPRPDMDQPGLSAEGIGLGAAMLWAYGRRKVPEFLANDARQTWENMKSRRNTMNWSIPGLMMRYKLGDWAEMIARNSFNLVTSKPLNWLDAGLEEFQKLMSSFTFSWLNPFDAKKYKTDRRNIWMTEKERTAWDKRLKAANDSGYGKKKGKKGKKKGGEQKAA